MTYYDFISAINARLKETGMSKWALAREVGVSKNAMYEWTNLHVRMPSDMMFMVLHKLDLDVAIIYRKEENDKS